MKNIFDAIAEQLPTEDTASWDLVIGCPEEGSDSFFSSSGCDIIDTLACDVETVDCALFKRNIAGRIIETIEFQADVCIKVLDAYHNGASYYQNDRGGWIAEHDIDFKQFKKAV